MSNEMDFGRYYIFLFLCAFLLRVVRIGFSFDATNNARNFKRRTAKSERRTALTCECESQANDIYATNAQSLDNSNNVIGLLKLVNTFDLYDSS